MGYLCYHRIWRNLSGECRLQSPPPLKEKTIKIAFIHFISKPQDTSDGNRNRDAGRSLLQKLCLSYPTASGPQPTLQIHSSSYIIINFSLLACLIMEIAMKKTLNLGFGRKPHYIFNLFSIFLLVTLQVSCTSKISFLGSGQDIFPTQRPTDGLTHRPTKQESSQSLINLFFILNASI